MKRKEVKLRLSPNEEAQYIREERERRRKLRLQQVREQQRYIAQRVRQKVEQRRQYELELLEEDLRAAWEQQQRERVYKMQKLYQESLSLIGQGQRNAKENEPDQSALHQKEINDRKAEERFHKALKELKLQRLKNQENENRSIEARKRALETERIRSAKVASLPLPISLQHQDTDFKPQHIVKKSDASAYAATHYHMPETMVDKEMITSQPNARIEAELEVERLQVIKKEEEQKKWEQQEKARLRGKQALRREQLEQDRGRLLVELEHMQQTDLLRRRQKVMDMPRHIFEPLYRRKETEVELQQELEFAFEDMYSGERRAKGDLMSQLVPEPLPHPFTGSSSQDLDVTEDESTSSDHNDAEHEDLQQKTTSISSESVEGKPAPRRGLKKLLDRIQTQRDQWSESNGAASSPSISTDALPEQDSSMDTGSLSVDKQSAEETDVPQVLGKQIQEIEEQKKKEEELEREKQAQIEFLEQLEQQRLQLEQSLLEAQQRRDCLKTSTTPTAHMNRKPMPVVGDSTKRIEEHRRRLLHQNEVHKRSVQQARQRLEEYQKSLRIRYNLPAIPTQVCSNAVSSTPAVQVQPLRCVKAQEKTQSSEEASTRELGPLCPGPDIDIDSETAPAQVPNSSDSALIQRQKALYQLIQNRIRSMTNSNLETSVPHTHLSARSSSDSSPDAIPGADPTSAIFKVVDPSPALSWKMFPSSSISERVDPSPAITKGVEPSTCVSKGVDPSPSGSKGVDPSPGVSKRVDPSPGVSKRVDPSCGVSKRVDPSPGVSKRVDPSPGVSKRVDPSPGVSKRVDPSPGVSKGVDLSPGIFWGVDSCPAISGSMDPSPIVVQGIEESLEKSTLQDIPNPSVLIQKRQEMNALRLEEHQQRQKEIEQARSNLLKSLIKAMEQSKLENSQQTSTTDSRNLSFGQTSMTTKTPVVAAKPPVSRRKLDTALHQLSVIEEVQTPASMSMLTGEDTVTLEDNKASLTPGPVQTEQTDSGASPGSSMSELAQHTSSVHSLDSGRGADYSGPFITSSKHLLECAHRLHHCLSSTISTGSYITTDPELPSQSDSDPVCVESPGSSPYHEYSQSQKRISLDPVEAAQAPQLVPVDSAVKTLLAEEHSLVENQEQDSFRPLVAQLAEQSSYMADENPGLEQLVGHPSAHSSVIGQLPTTALTSDFSGWDSSVSHWRGGLFHQMHSLWQSTSQDFVPSEHHGEQSTLGSHENKSSVEPTSSSVSPGFHQLHAEITDNQMEATNLETLGQTEPMSPERMRAEESSSHGGLLQEPVQFMSLWSPSEMSCPGVLGLFGEEGILEQSMITLQSLTNSSLDLEESEPTEELGHRAVAQHTEMLPSDKMAARMNVENLRSVAGVKELELDQAKRREVTIRGEPSAQKGLKAHQFHQKTLQKLRAKPQC